MPAWRAPPRRWCRGRQHAAGVFNMDGTVGSNVTCTGRAAYGGRSVAGRCLDDLRYQPAGAIACRGGGSRGNIVSAGVVHLHD